MSGLHRQQRSRLKISRFPCVQTLKSEAHSNFAQVHENPLRSLSTTWRMLHSVKCQNRPRLKSQSHGSVHTMFNIIIITNLNVDSGISFLVFSQSHRRILLAYEWIERGTTGGIPHLSHACSRKRAARSPAQADNPTPLWSPPS